VFYNFCDDVETSVNGSCIRFLHISNDSLEDLTLRKPLTSSPAVPAAFSANENFNIYIETKESMKMPMVVSKSLPDRVISKLVDSSNFTSSTTLMGNSSNVEKNCFLSVDHFRDPSKAISVKTGDIKNGKGIR